MLYSDFQSGISQSKYLKGGFNDMANVDILTEVGTARCNKGLVKESGTTLTAPVLFCITKTGLTYLFSMLAGNIWTRSSAGVYGVATANTQAGGHQGCLFYDNWVYYCTQTKIGRFRYDQSSKGDTYATFKNSSAVTHPFVALNRFLFIGDQEALARLDTHGNFSNIVVGLEAHQDIVVAMPFSYDIILFTKAGNYILKAGAFRYDTYSAALSSADYIDEQGIRVAINSNTSDELFLLAGDNGDIYQFDGIKFHWINKIKDITSVSTGNQLSASVGKKSYFSTGNGVIYSLSHPIPGGQAVLNKEFTVSAGAGATIYSMVGYGSQLLVSWGLTGTYGVDKIDTNYATATLDTPVHFGKARNIRVYYESLPANTSIGISFKNDNASTWTDKTMAAGEVINNSIEKYVELKAEPGNKRSIEARATLNPYNTGTPVTPVIQGIEVISY